jgi:hypothetical protein
VETVTEAEADATAAVEAVTVADAAVTEAEAVEIATAGPGTTEVLATAEAAALLRSRIELPRKTAARLPRCRTASRREIEAATTTSMRDSDRGAKTRCG